MKFIESFIRDYTAESEILYILELLYVYFLKLMSICYARTNWKWKRQASILRLPFFIASYVFESLSLSSSPFTRTIKSYDPGFGASKESKPSFEK